MEKSLQEKTWQLDESWKAENDLKKHISHLEETLLINITQLEENSKSEENLRKINAQLEENLNEKFRSLKKV